MAMGVLLFFRTTAKNRLMIVAVAVVMAAVGPLLLSSDLRARYSTILGGSAGKDSALNEQEANVIDSADESKEGRVELIRYAFLLTAHNPIFGVGLFQFAPSAVDLAVSEGKVMGWHPVHSFLLLVMAETGIPGVILYTSVLFFCLRSLLRIGKFTRHRKDLRTAREVSETLLYSFVGFATCMLFSPSAYTFQFPLMAALVTALYLFTKDQIASETREARPAPRMPARHTPTPGIRKIATLGQRVR
jgi:O-antigen ligase